MQLGLLGILDAYIAHQKEIVYKGTEYDLKTARASYHIMEGLIKAIPQLISKIPQIVSSLVRGFVNYYSNMGEVGKNLVLGIWEGIKNGKI